jgi:hypothetical protein
MTMIYEFEFTPRFFVPAGERESRAAELPGVGAADLLGRSPDGLDTYWLSAVDGSVWAGRGKPDEPVEEAHGINSSLEAFRAILAATHDFEAADLDEQDEGYEELVFATIVRAVSADPGVFEDEEGRWPLYFEELEYTLPDSLAGDAALYQLVRRDEAGRWVLDHPGYDDDDVDEDED